jgi:hypothetical protein
MVKSKQTDAVMYSDFSIIKKTYLTIKWEFLWTFKKKGEKMWFCHLFSKYDIFQRSFKSLNYYYLIFLSRISTCFILYALCDIFIHTYEIRFIWMFSIIKNNNLTNECEFLWTFKKRGENEKSRKIHKCPF